MVLIRRVWPVAAVVVLLALAALTLVAVHRPAPPLSARVDGVARTLRCPTCQGESAAASDSPIARSMRAEVRQQLTRGRSPEQIRAWFVGRYGDSIVTTPPSGGAGVVLWLAPLVALALGALLVTVFARARADANDARPPRAGPRALSRRGVLLAVLACLTTGVAVPTAIAAGSHSTSSASAQLPATGRGDPLSPGAWLRLGRSLDRQGDPGAAERAYRRALAGSSTNAAARTRLAFDLLRRDRWVAAEQLAAPVARRPGRYRPLALLVLGLAQRGRHQPTATETLRTFLRLAPHHAAAAQVRRLLRTS